MTRAQANRTGLKALVDAGNPLLLDKPRRSSDDQMWFGAKSMCDSVGFEEVARRKPQRPIVRLNPVGANSGQGA